MIIDDTNWFKKRVVVLPAHIYDMAKQQGRDMTYYIRQEKVPHIEKEEHTKE